MPLGRDTGKEAGGDEIPPASFEGRILALMPSMRRYARSLTRSDSDGEDLLHDSLERVLARRGQWTGINLRAWAFTIMTNLYRNGIGRTRRFPSTNIDEAEEIAAPASIGDPLERRQLTAALNSLSPEHRAVLMLVVIEGYSYQEVAEMMQTPIGTVMSRLSRARSQMSIYLEKNNVVPLRRPE
jgi:RNA polymerase sigma-70 factor (ECF subfamily)